MYKTYKMNASPQVTGNFKIFDLSKRRPSQTTIQTNAYLEYFENLKVTGSGNLHFITEDGIYKYNDLKEYTDPTTYFNNGAEFGISVFMYNEAQYQTVGSKEVIVRELYSPKTESGAEATVTSPNRGPGYISTPNVDMPAVGSGYVELTNPVSSSDLIGQSANIIIHLGNNDVIWNQYTSGGSTHTIEHAGVSGNVGLEWNRDGTVHISFGTPRSPHRITRTAIITGHTTDMPYTGKIGM